MRPPALLVLEDGFIARGEQYGAAGETFGELVFATGMTGYQETLTDPSYRHQIIIQTAPHIGNTGVVAEDDESDRIWAAGYVVRDPSRRASNWRATGELEERLVAEGVVGICGVDTRALTRHVREAGAMRAAIFSGEALPHGAANGDAQAHGGLVDLVRQSPEMVGANLVGEVSTDDAYVVEPDGEHVATVVAIDLGMKRQTPRHLARRGCRVHVLPHDATLADVHALAPDGVFLSNGPGDPAAATSEIELARELLASGIPVFGICFGHQVLAAALGYRTYKLPYGHRGVNQPVREVATGRIEITAHNHGFAVDAPVGEAVPTPFEDGRFGRAEVSHIDLNDGVVEGIRCLDLPAFSVQYHPEAASGPHDGEHMFDRFVTLMRDHKEA